jgi:hypothetical protein
LGSETLDAGSPAPVRCQTFRSRLDRNPQYRHRGTAHASYIRNVRYARDFASVLLLSADIAASR